jgi:anthranilate phosphoribosyltransferase
VDDRSETRYGFGEGVGGRDRRCATPAVNAATIVRVLRGDGNEPSKAAVVLNAAAAFYVGGKTASFDEGVDAANDAIRAGVGLVALKRLREAFTLPLA